MATGWLEQGRVKGVRETVQRQLEKRFGPLKQEALQRLDALPIEKVEDLSLAILDAKSLDDLGLGNAPPPSAN